MQLKPLGRTFWLTSEATVNTVSLGLARPYTMMQKHQKRDETSAQVFICFWTVIFVVELSKIQRAFKLHLVGLYYTQGRRQGGPGKPGPPNRHACPPPINKLTFLKTAVFALNFKLWPLLLIKVWPPEVNRSGAGSDLTVTTKTKTRCFFAN